VHMFKDHIVKVSDSVMAQFRQLLKNIK